METGRLLKKACGTRGAYWNTTGEGALIGDGVLIEYRALIRIFTVIRPLFVCDTFHCCFLSSTGHF